MPNASNPYPTLRLIGRHGYWISVLLGALPVLIAVGTTLSGHSPAWLIVGIGAGLLTYGLARSYVELVMLITDMLLPR